MEWKLGWMGREYRDRREETARFIYMENTGGSNGSSRSVDRLTVQAQKRRVIDLLRSRC